MRNASGLPVNLCMFFVNAAPAENATAVCSFSLTAHTFCITPSFSCKGHYSSLSQVLSIECLDAPALPAFFHFLNYYQRVSTADGTRNSAGGLLFISGRPAYSSYTGEKPENRSRKDPARIDLFSSKTLYRCAKIRSTPADNGE